MDALASEVSSQVDWSVGAATRARVNADAQAIVDAVDVETLVDVETFVGTVDTDGYVDAVELALDDRQRAILDFERQWWKRPGAKEQAIRDHFDVSPTRYYQALNALLDLPQALTYDAALVNRLQRVRDTAVRTRRLR